jgi:hypothetical protein
MEESRGSDLPRVERRCLSVHSAVDCPKANKGTRETR